jgi:hypothetical protein
MDFRKKAQFESGEVREDWLHQVSSSPDHQPFLSRNATPVRDDSSDIRRGALRPPLRVDITPSDLRRPHRRSLPDAQSHAGKQNSPSSVFCCGFRRKISLRKTPMTAPKMCDEMPKAHGKVKVSSVFLHSQA